MQGIFVLKIYQNAFIKIIQFEDEKIKKKYKNIYIYKIGFDDFFAPEVFKI